MHEQRKLSVGATDLLGRGVKVHAQLLEGVQLEGLQYPDDLVVPVHRPDLRIKLLRPAAHGMVHCICGYRSFDSRAHQLCTSQCCIRDTRHTGLELGRTVWQRC